MKISKVTIGADPELFLVNTKTNKIVSSIGLIPGLKGEAYQPEGFKEGFGLQIDNILAEFNIPPVTRASSFTHHIEAMKKYIVKYVQAKNPDLDILCVASAEVDDDQLGSAEAKEFGCSVDYNVYTQAPNPRPEGEKTNLRTTGFHVHVGYENPTIDNSLDIVRYMDAYLGLPSILMDEDNKRRQLYGKAGCFRLCPYGVEYRVLSGFFISSPELIAWVYGQTQKAIHACNRSYRLPNSEEVQKAINNCDVTLAKSLIERFELQ